MPLVPVQFDCRLPFLTGGMTQTTVSLQSQTYWLCAFTRLWNPQHFQRAATASHSGPICSFQRPNAARNFFFPADTETPCSSLQHLAPALAGAAGTPTQGATGPAFPVLGPSRGEQVLGEGS